MNEFKKYLNATGGLKSYQYNDYTKSDFSSIDKFIYISDHFEELKQKFFKEEIEVL